MTTNSLVSRVLRVLRFDIPVYKEVAADKTAMGQAAMVVVAAAILSGIGSLSQGLTAVLLGAVFAVLTFAIYSAVATVVSRALFKGKTDFQEMGRTLGFAYAWSGIGVLGLIPVLGGVITFLSGLAGAVAGVIALRESSEFDTVKAIVTVVIAAIVAAVIVAIVSAPIFIALGIARGATS